MKERERRHGGGGGREAAESELPGALNNLKRILINSFEFN